MKRIILTSFTLFNAISILMIFTHTSNSQQDVNGWFWLNGQPQGNNVYWTQVINSENIVAVTARGLFMKSTDGGDTWTITQAGAPDLSSTGNLAKRDLFTGCFHNPTTGIVAGAPQTGTPSKTVVSKTTDGGTTWTINEVNSTAGGSINDIHFINSTTGYLCGATNARLYKTTNQGETWTNISSVPANTYNSLHAFDENNILLATSYGRIVRTTNGGTSWIIDTLFTASSSVEFLGITFKDANTGYVVGNPNYFAYTTNAGANWTASTHSSIRGQRSVVYDSGKVWTAGDYEWLFFSNDNGISWDSVKFYDNSNVNQPPPSTIRSIGVNGNDLVVAGQTGRVTMSNDGGVTWSNKNYSVSNGGTETYSAIYVESVNGRIWVAPGGGGNILHSTNGGANWTAQPTAHFTSIFTIDFVDANTSYICGGSFFAAQGQMSVTTNAGANWNLLTLPAPINNNQLNSCDFVDFNTGWVTGGSGSFGLPIIYKTTNGGATWAAQSLPNAPLGFGVSVQMVDANVGYLKTSDAANQLYYTSDGGSNWIRNTTSQATTIAHSNMFVLNRDVVYLNGNGSNGLNKVIRSLDGGTTWIDLTSNLISTADILKTKWLNIDHGVVCGINGYVAKTANGGISWESSNPGFSTIADIQFPDVNNLFTISVAAYQIGKKYDSTASIPNPTPSKFFQVNSTIDSITTLNTDWGVLQIDCSDLNGPKYLNLSINTPGLETNWQIQNAPISDLSELGLVEYFFDIGTTGTNVSSVNYGLTLTDNPLNSPPFVTANSAVAEYSTDLFLDLEEVPDTGSSTGPENQAVPYIGGAFDLSSSYMHQNYPNQQCGRNECGPAGISNSLRFLNTDRNWGLDPNELSIEALKPKNVLDWNVDTGIDNKPDINTPEAWVKKKDKFMQDKNRPIKTRKKKKGSFTGTDLKRELMDKQDIEIYIRSKKSGNNWQGHIVSLVGIESLNAGRWEIATIDDHDQKTDTNQLVLKKTIWNSSSNTFESGYLDRLESTAKGSTGIQIVYIECPTSNDIPTQAISPSGNGTKKKVKLKGKLPHPPVVDVTHRFQICKDSNCTQKILDVDSVDSLTYDVPDSLLHNDSTYFWRLSSDNDSLGPGFFSNTLSFTVLPRTELGISVCIEGTAALLAGIDTITVLLRNAAPPHNIEDSIIAILDFSTKNMISFLENTSTDSFYLVIKHRNALETWSSQPVSITSGTPVMYDFTTSSSQAYGNNLVNVAANWCLFSGDVNQDGTIDATDVGAIDNDASNFVSGYVVTDLTGDNFVDGTDFAIADNNAANFVSVIRP